ncbi:MAG: TRAP transporter small permease subunit, partial [Ardenticatenaceae bacterium]
MGRTIAWLVLATVLLTFAVAILRYGMSFGRIWLQELYVWTHATVFMVAAGYTLLHDGHVRVDVFYQKAGPQPKAWINLLGTLFFLFPTLGVITWVIFPY